MSRCRYFLHGISASPACSSTPSKGIKTPADLAGKRIGVPVFDMAAAVWLRGIFQDHYGLARTSPIYVAGGLETARTGDEHPQFYPDKFKHEERTDKSLAVLLAEGEIDALYTARAPSTWPSNSVSRLFENPMQAELDYYSKTGIFPPMHLIAVKRTIAESNPGLMLAIFDAFAQAQNIARARLFDSAALCTMLPWQLESLHFHGKPARRRLLAGRICEKPRHAGGHCSLHGRGRPDRNDIFARRTLFYRRHFANLETFHLPLATEATSSPTMPRSSG